MASDTDAGAHLTAARKLLVFSTYVGALFSGAACDFCSPSLESATTSKLSVTSHDVVVIDGCLTPRVLRGVSKIVHCRRFTFLLWFLWRHSFLPFRKNMGGPQEKCFRSLR